MTWWSYIQASPDPQGFSWQCAGARNFKGPVIVLIKPRKDNVSCSCDMIEIILRGCKTFFSQSPVFLYFSLQCGRMCL